MSGWHKMYHALLKQGVNQNEAFRRTQEHFGNAVGGKGNKIVAAASEVARIVARIRVPRKKNYKCGD